MKMSPKNRQKKISVLFVSMVNVSQRMEQKFQKSGNMRHPMLVGVKGWREGGEEKFLSQKV